VGRLISNKNLKGLGIEVTGVEKKIREGRYGKSGEHRAKRTGAD